MRYFSFAFVSRLLAVVLVLAGASTAYDTLNTPGSFSTQPSLHLAGAAAELAFGLWLLVGLYPRLSWAALVGCFTLFLGVSLDRAVDGESSCGCFGRFQVNPWYTFAFDAAALVALACAQPFGQPSLDRVGPWRRWAGYAFLLGIAVIGLGVSTYSAKAHLGDDGAVIGQGDDVPLAPRDWVGSRFPLAQHIDLGQELMEGRWALMFYHPDCGACRTTLPEFVGLAYQLGNQDRSRRFALIEVPHRGTPPAAPSRETNCLRGHLSADYNWRIPTPTFLLLDGGVVSKVSDQLDGVYRELGVRGVESEEPQGGVLFPDYGKIRREMFLKEIACGPLALMRMLDAFGKPFSPEEAEQLVDEAGDKGIDMLRLKELAEQRGLHALGVAVSPEKFRQLGQRAIVYLDGVGFVPVLGFTSGGVILAYPLTPAGVLPDDLFAKSFGSEGKALLVSDKPLNPDRLGLPALETVEEKSQGPRLRAGRSILAVGRLYRMNWEASLTLTNDGNEAVEIKGIKTNCPCFTAAVDRKTLAPGESTPLRAKGTQDQAGGFTYAITIETNEGERSPLRIPVRGYLERPVTFSPPMVAVREVLPGEKAETEIQVELPRRMNLAELKLTAPKEGALTAELVRREQGAALLVHWAGAKEPGFYRGEFEVRAVDAKDAVAAKLPFVIEVVPPITASPPSLRIEGSAGSPWTRLLSIESPRDFAGTPSVRWVPEEAGKAIQTTVTKDGARVYRIKLSGTLPANRVPLALVVVVGDKSVSIPIRFVKVGE